MAPLSLEKGWAHRTSLMLREDGIIMTIYIISNATTRQSKSSKTTINYIILNLVFSTQHGVLQGNFLDYIFNQLNYSFPKIYGQMAAYFSRRLVYNCTGETSRSFPWNTFPFPILITDRLVSVTGIIIICLSSRFLNKDGNCIQKLLFHTLLIHTVRLFTLHAWVAILSLKIQGNMITRILQAYTHFHLFSLASVSIYRIITALMHGCQLSPCCISCWQRCLLLPGHMHLHDTCRGLLVHANSD